MSKEVTYKCDICEESRDERCFIGIGKDSDKDMYFDDISKTNKHVCVSCINDVFIYMDTKFIKVEGRWTFKKEEREQ